ncbi:sugar transferase [Thaumasiovibrio sp. DFM-14]|uniref:sugar transferase n=1 Tax=Thaumasiovibrio sp. DFM-14 TaxID=3384792 RepID=UPI0039A187CB
MTFLWFILFLSLILIVYHHIIYLPIMIALSHRQKMAKHSNAENEIGSDAIDDDDLTDTWPTIALVMSAYNEADYLDDKLANILMLDYPCEHLHVYIACDGSSDGSADILHRWSARFQEHGVAYTIINDDKNVGKLQRINQLASTAKQIAPFIAFTDVSALISIDALKLAVTNFAKPNVGAITSQYLLANPEEGEEKYWQLQNKIRLSESSLGNVMGGSGAFYIMRSALFAPLPCDTINDDFMLPMSVIEQGYQVILNQDIHSVEIAPTSHEQELKRRERIGAGNLQQLLRCRFLLRPQRLTSAWLFASGKGLRTLMPFILILCALSTAMLALTGHLFAISVALLQIIGYSVALLPICRDSYPSLNKINYLVMGYYSALIGMWKYMRGHFSQGWRQTFQLHHYQNGITRTLKRGTDILLSILGFIITLPLWPLIALAIKLETPGPIFFKQLRVGQVHADRVELFYMIKFRSMGQYAEQKTGAVWASKNDPRITRVGAFLRKTRLDELPQFINVIIGDMSLIGPRPERPEFCQRLQNALPFYTERTAGLKPGITGLAQVNNGYDESLEDVKNKLLWDHAYSAALSSPIQWVTTDLRIIAKTVYIMVAGRGQ